MRLHRLRVSAFLAFPGVEEVDFDALGEAGLFLLQGRTGAGKTSLLDAVCFAFYGEVPGERGKDARLRSDHAAADLLTEVELEATVRGQRIRITRVPAQQRPKLRGTGTTDEAHSVTLVAVGDGSERVLATKLEEARSELRHLLGLSCQQFCQVVLLPQGGFARFLQANSGDREVLLRELFHVERFTDVEKWLLDRRSQAEAARSQAGRAVRDVLERSAQVAEAEAPDECETSLELAEQWLDERLVIAEASRATAESSCVEASDRSRHAARALEDAQALARRQAELRHARAALKEWQAGRQDHEAREAELAAARRAAPAQASVAAVAAREETAATRRREAEVACGFAADAGIEPERRADAYRAVAAGLGHDVGAAQALLERERRVDHAAGEVARLGAELEELDGEVGRLGAELEKAEAARPDVEARLSATLLGEALLTGRREAAEVAARRVKSGAERDRLGVEFLAAREQLVSAGEDLQRARDHHSELFGRRLEGMAAELAARLEDGGECPVCGSVDHPKPAAPPEGGLISADQVEKAQQVVAKQEKLRDDLAKSKTDVETKLSAAEAIAGATPVTELETAARAAAQDLSATEAAAAGVAATREERDLLEQRIATLREQLASVNGDRHRVATDLDGRAKALDADRAEVDAARAGHPSIAARIEHLKDAAQRAEAAAAALEVAAQATTEADDARALAARAATDAGFDNVDALAGALRDASACGALESAIEAWGRELDKRAHEASRPELAACAELPAPDLETLESAAVAAAEAASQAQEKLGQARACRENLERLRKRLADEVAAARPVNERYAVVRELADLARGTGASNRRKMPLSAYVLAARLEEVAAAATVRLQRMSGGRYSLEHADDAAKGNRRGGLDLRIVDAWTGRDRAPSSLSGGETFLTSLALALGLADTVTAEAGGAELETLFIDEGFGSLDDEGTLHDVLEVLDGLRDGGRTIGIVSHVAELRQRIPTQLRIEKGRTGSRIVPMTVAPA